METYPQWDELLTEAIVAAMPSESMVAFEEFDVVVDSIRDAVYEWLERQSAKDAPGMNSEPPKCDDWWEDDDSVGIGHECRLPKGHHGDHVCMHQDDDQDWCRWHNWADDDTDTPDAR